MTTAALPALLPATTRVRLRAIEVLERHKGLCQHYYYDEATDRVSLIGALREAVCPGYVRSATTFTTNELYGDVLRELDRELGMGVREWADMPGRTLADVVALLRGVGA